MCARSSGRQAAAVPDVDLSRELGRLLGVKFWEVSPLDADSEAPPKWMRHNDCNPGTGSKHGR